MKKYIVASLCTLGSLSAMDMKPPVSREPREWMAEEYAKGNAPQFACFTHWLKKYNINTQNKNVLSIGCGTGEIEAYLAKEAKSVHGIDASKNMVDYAQSTHIDPTNHRTLSFEHCFVEDFEPKEKLYQLAIASCCFHWFTDQPQALACINKSLEKNGLFFANIDTAGNPEPLGITVYNEMISKIPIIGSLLSVIPNPTGSSRPTNNELYDMLETAGLTMISSQEESFNWNMTEQEWRQFQLSLLLSTPGSQKLINATSKDNWTTNQITEQLYRCFTLSPEEQRQHDEPFFPQCSDELVQKIRDNNFCRYLFNNFLNRCLAKLQKNEDGTYTYPYVTTVILAAKK